MVAVNAKRYDKDNPWKVENVSRRNSLGGRSDIVSRGVTHWSLKRSEKVSCSAFSNSKPACNVQVRREK